MSGSPIDHALINALRIIKNLLETAQTATQKQEPPSPLSRNDTESKTSDPVAEGTAICSPKVLPEEIQGEAASTARSIYPGNAPVVAGFASSIAGAITPLHIAVMTSKYWGPTRRTLSVSFMETVRSDLRSRIISHMNAWGKTCGVKFSYTSGRGKVRIAFERDGYWSYLGTDILHVPMDQQTMNLEGFTMNTPDSEYRRIIRHETGHTLGFPHEHMRRDIIARLDRTKVIEWARRTQGWDEATAIAQILTPLDEASLMATPPDQTSIMCYQLPASLTTDGKPVLGGTDINTTDYAFAGKIYPKCATTVATVDNPFEDELSAHPGGFIAKPDLSEFNDG